MIIDTHYHMMPQVSAGVIKGLITHARHAAGVMGISIDSETINKRSQKVWGDPDGARLIQGMAEEGVDVTVICVVDVAGIAQYTAEMAQQTNQTAAKIAAKYPDQVIALAGVDPRRPEASDMLRQCFEEYGMRGLKYHPDYGYDPVGPESYKLLEIMQANQGVLLSHTGPLMPPSRCRYTDPMLLSDIGVDFPDVKVVGAHMGMAEWRRWANLALFQPNLYGDLAMWDGLAFGHYNLFCRELRDLIDYVGVEKVLFGTDNPVYQVIRATKDWIQLIKDLPEKAPAGIDFSETEVEAILGGNAATLFEI